MSHQAIVWALAQPVKPAPAKHILTVLAHYVSAKNNGPWIAFPSVSQLVKDTGQDRKTVLVNIKRLLDSGYIVDTGERSGATNSVPIYRLGPPASSTGNGTSSDQSSSTDSGTSSDLEAVPKTEHLSSPKFPEAVPDFPISSTENGTPIKDGSSPKFPWKQSQNTPEAVPDFPTEQVEQVGTGIRARGTRLSQNWQLSQKNGRWALEKNPAWTADDVREQAEAFRDYWTAATGQAATKRDWDAAWRNWVRKAIDFSPRRGAAARVAEEAPWEGAL